MKFLTCLFILLLALHAESYDDPITESNIRALDCDGWRWPWEENKCECNYNERIIEIESKKFCVNKEVKNLCLEEEDGFQKVYKTLGFNELTNCLTFDNINSSSVGFESRSTILDIYNLSKDEVVQFTVLADEYKKTLSSMNRPTTSNGEGEYIQISGEIQGLMVRNVLDPVLMPIEIVKGVETSNGLKYFSSAEDYLIYLKNPKSKFSLKKDNFASDFSELIEYYHLNVNPELEIVKTLSVDGCKLSCIKQAETTSSKGNKILIREYQVEERSYRSEILLYKKNDSIASAIILIDNYPSILLSFKRDNENYPIEVKAYNRQGKLLFDKGNSVLSNENIQQELSRFSMVPFEQNRLIGLCETQIHWKSFKENNLEKNIAFGPNKNHSFYGWSLAEQSWSHYFFGRQPLNSLDLPYNRYDYENHAVTVSDILVRSQASSNDIGIIPIGTDACIWPTLTEEWFKTAASEGMRVVNVSVSERMDYELCDQLKRDHPVSKDRNVLWVIAAGNEGRENPPLCPQQFSGEENVIIVGASRWGRMHPNSNFGVNYVDITTSGDSYIGNQWGTSFAAPHVARFAAELMYKYPKLSAKQIKLSIVLGAESPYYQLPTRAGGDVNFLQSEEIAQNLNNGKSIQESLKNTYCENSYYLCQKAKVKNEIYESHFNGGEQ